MVEQTSLLAYKGVEPHLGAMQQAVYDVIEKFGPITQMEIASRLKRPINTVTPRVNELAFKGFATVHGVGTNGLGHTAKLWVIKDPNDKNLAEITKEPLEQDCEI